MKRLSELAPPKPPAVPTVLCAQPCIACRYVAIGRTEAAVRATWIAHFNAKHGYVAEAER